MELNNRTLALLLVAAIAISTSGTIISLNKIDSMSQVTGFATSTGTANLSILSTASVRFATSTLDLGAGFINTTGGFFVCNLTSNSTARINKTIPACINFTTDTGAVAPLIIENNGNVGLNITLNVSVNASQWIGGGAAPAGGPSFQVQVYENESGSCNTGLNATMTNFTEVTRDNYQNVTATTNGAQICRALGFSDTANTLVVGVKIKIPYDATGQDKRATFLVTGT